MTDGASALYTGTVTHQRLRPRRHRLRYRVFWLLLDLDEIDDLAGQLKFFSRNHFNLLSFHDRDYGAGTAEPLRSQIERHMRTAGLDSDGGPIRLLTMPRLLGYVFNPISIYFCYCRTGPLAATIYEVNNTFGERHSYVVPVTDDGGASGQPIRQSCDKSLYVSPFLDMNMTYAFRVTPPAERVRIAISTNDAEGPILLALLSARQAKLSDPSLAFAFASHPLLTLKVIAGIHWEALLIWLKGIALRSRPAPPATAITVGHPTDHESRRSHVA